MTIWKYEIRLRGPNDVAMPEGATVLCVQVQRNAIFLWARVHPDSPQEPRHFRVYGTGHVMCGGESYVGTVQIGEFVWHVYESKTKEVPDGSSD